MTMTPAATIRATPARSFVRVDALPGGPVAARKAASRAVSAGELVPVRKGLYYRGVPTKYGMTKPSTDEVAREVLGDRGIGPAGYSAARAWGVTTQVPPVLHLAVLFPTDPIPGIKQSSRRNPSRMDLNGLEIALLELLREPELFVEAGWDVLVGRVRDAAREGLIRLDALKEAVPGESSVAPREHFARLLDDLGLEAHG